MKQIFLLLAGMLLACPLFSQEYQPRDTWPFIYESFLPGATRTVDGALATEASFNIAVYDGTLMYIGADQTLMRADMSRVFSAKIGEDVYYNSQGQLIRSIILFSVLIYELTGPMMTKIVLTKSGDIQPKSPEVEHRRQLKLEKAEGKR